MNGWLWIPKPDIELIYPLLDVKTMNVPGTGEEATADDVQFHSCDGIGQIFRTVLHEVGHVFGIGHAFGVVDDTVMRSVPFKSCSPEPLDEMLIQALYQIDN